MAFWTYLLKCSDGRFYTGHTEDLAIRLAQHERGCFPNCWTYARRPVELVWSEEMPTRDEAREAERIVGGWSRAKKEALIESDWNMVSYLARPPRERNARVVGDHFSTSLETDGDGVQLSAAPVDAIENPNPSISSEVEKRDRESGESP